jgi:hypothetical protein
MDFGYVTHAVHANSRYVELVSSLQDNMITVNGPPNGNIYPPGPGWLMVVVDDVPSKAIKVMIGDGNSPEVNKAAIAKYVSPVVLFTNVHFELIFMIASCLILAQTCTTRTKKSISSMVPNKQA